MDRPASEQRDSAHRGTAQPEFDLEAEPLVQLLTHSAPAAVRSGGLLTYDEDRYLCGLDHLGRDAVQQ
jgi:hypothetical protein